jgi:hypothetical protein
MPDVREHHSATREREALPTPVRQAVEDVVLPTIAADPHARALTREKLSYPRHPLVLIWGKRYLKTTYRMAWEVFQSKEVLVLMYGAHEGFYERLKRRFGAPGKP